MHHARDGHAHTPGSLPLKKRILMTKLPMILILCLCWGIGTHAEERNLLSGPVSEKDLQEMLMADAQWIRFPAYVDRQAWARIPESIRDLLIRQGEESLAFEWGVVKATDYLAFVRSGDRDVMQHPMNARTRALQRLVLAELVEGQGRFLDQIINGIWALAEQTSWSLSAHMYLQEAGYGLPDVEEPVIDLITGEIASLFSWTHYFLKDEFDKVDTLIDRRICLEIRRRVLDVYDAREDFWWMGFEGGQVNNWNVWVNHNMLTTLLLMEEAPDRKARNIYKSMRSVDRFINYYPPDGGCDEGPSYWGHAGGALYEYLEILQEATDGKIILFDREIIRNIGRYIYRAQIAYPWVINFADAAARSGSRPGIVYRYGKSIRDPVMQAYGAFLAEKAHWDENVPGGNLETTLTNLFQLQEILQAEAKEPLLADFFLPDLQICGARDREGTAEGFYFAAKGGNNGESHNHNDVGNFILYYNGQPGIIDVGVGTYTRQTFSPDRWKIWTMQSQYHNTPTINGQQQPPGKQYRAENVAFENRGREIRFQADLAGAYPEDAMVRNWFRTISLKRGKSFTVTEDFLLEKNAGGTSVNIMTCIMPQIGPDGQILLKGKDFTLSMEYDERRTTMKIEQEAITDPRLSSIWGEAVYRLVFTWQQDKTTGQLAFVLKPQ
jgi:hypothetical protein